MSFYKHVTRATHVTSSFCLQPQHPEHVAATKSRAHLSLSRRRPWKTRCWLLPPQLQERLQGNQCNLSKHSCSLCTLMQTAHCCTTEHQPADSYCCNIIEKLVIQTRRHRQKSTSKVNCFALATLSNNRLFLFQDHLFTCYLQAVQVDCSHPGSSCPAVF